MSDIVPFEANIAEIIKILPESETNKILNIREELIDTYNKNQIFRTETEAKVSVLNDGNHPTNASKYWQAVREQNGMFQQLILDSFNLRRLDIKLKKLQRKLEKTTDDLKIEKIKVDIEEALFCRKNMEKMAVDRIREIEMWSKLKAEVNDGTFDTQNVNDHQMKSLRLSLESRARALGNSSSGSEILNVFGPLATADRLDKTDKNLRLTGKEGTPEFQVPSLPEKIRIA